MLASADNAIPQRAYNNNRQRMIGIPILARACHYPICNCTSVDAPLGAGQESIPRWWLWIPDSLAEPVIGPARGRTRWLAIRNDAFQKREAAATRSRVTAASDCQTLLLVADAVDRAGPVVGDEHRTILGKHD